MMTAILCGLYFVVADAIGCIRGTAVEHHPVMRMVGGIALVAFGFAGLTLSTDMTWVVGIVAALCVALSYRFGSGGQG